jgi:hypothetical protein
MAACAQCFGFMGLVSGMLDRKHGLRNVKPVKQTKKWHLDETSVAKASYCVSMMFRGDKICS